ncbi:MAG: two-component regulator propeller domain-containing protein [Rikenellaceae bacterium]
MKYIDNIVCILLLSLLSLLPNDAVARAKFVNYGTVFSTIDNRNGLPSDYVTDVSRDNEGYVWIATAEGLCRYDGYRIKHYYPFVVDGVVSQNNNIKSVFCDSTGEIWLATKGGVFRFDPKREEFRRVDHDRLSTNNIASIVEDSEGGIWIASMKSLFRYSKIADRFEEMHYAADNSQLRDISELFCDSSGNVWIGFWSDGFARYDYTSARFEVCLKPSGTISGVISFFEDLSGDIFLGLWMQGMVRVVGGEDMMSPLDYEQIQLPESLAALKTAIVFFILHEDVFDSYWIGTANGIYILDDIADPQKMRYIRSQHDDISLSNNAVVSYCYDRSEQIMWFGTTGGGVNKIDLDPKFITGYDLYSIKNSFNSNEVRSIYRKGRTMWIGVKGAGLVLRDMGQGDLTHVRNVDVLKDLSVESNCVNVIKPLTSRNEMWLGTRYAGIAVVTLDSEGAPESLEHLAIDKTARNITALFEDSWGRVWIGTKNGLFRAEYKGERWFVESLYSNDSDGIPQGSVSAITADGRGRIWITMLSRGVYSTLLDSRDHTFKRYEPSLPNRALDRVETIFCDTKYDLWLGTSGLGLLKYSFERDCFEEVDAEFFNQVYTVNSIIEREPGNLWLGTNVGVFNYKVTKSGDKTFSHYTHDDGLSCNTMVSNSIFKYGGEIYIGGYNGMSMIRPGNIKEIYSAEANVSITDVIVAGQSILYPESSESVGIERSESGELKQITIPHDKNTFSLEFSSLSFSNPMKNRYQYKLEGYDEKWHEVDALHRVALYSNIGWGRYKFLVKGSNDRNIYSDKLCSVDVKIARPLYASFGAILLYVIVLLVLLYITYNNIVTRIRLRNRLLEESMEKMKIEEVNEVKLKFFTNVSHEFLTPLSIISCGIEELDAASPKDLQIHDIMRNNLSRLMRMLDQILEFRKAESSNLRLKVAYGDIATWVDTLARDNFTPLVKRRNIDFVIECDPKTLCGWFDRDKLDKMLYNLISNAFKYNVEGGYVRVEMRGVKGVDDLEYSEVEISVRNSGAVISSDHRKNLFKRFYDGEFRRFGVRGTGIGLSLTHNLVELHQGVIEVESSKESGTCFKITLPISESAYSEDQIDRDTSGEILFSEAEKAQILSLSSDETSGESESEQGERLPILLLVEDDKDLSTMMISLLSKYYTVEHAENGAVGLEKVQSINPDIIVSDVLMPVMDGLDMCRELKRNINTSHIPIVLLSAKLDNETKADGLNVGAQAYLTKPVQPKVLYAQIDSLLKSSDEMRGHFMQTNITIPQIEYASVDEKFLARAVEVVNNNVDNSDFDIKDFIEAMGMTNSMLYRKLKSLTGLSPNEFLRNIRLKSAHKIITEKYETITISEVAYKVGFNIPKYFTACFKKEYGITPSQYKDQLVEAANANRE